MIVATMAAVHEEGFLPVHRIEALTDGIFAVAMTLLVIELKLPDHDNVHTAGQLAEALAALIPKAISWVLSFFVLAVFWIGHHRVFAHVRHADAKLVALNLLELAAASLMPFSAALSGEYGSALLSQVVFSGNMALLGLAALLVLRHVHAHPGLGPVPMPLARYRGARLRIVGVILISVLAVGIGAFVTAPAVGNMAFMLMAVISPMSRRLEPIWKTKTETAVRLRGRIESILDWATVRGYRHGLNPARWKGHLSVMLPAPRKVANAEHHAALPYADMPGFMARLRAVEGESAQALQIAILTAARSGEVRGATWHEVDFDAKAWTVPAERMKAKKPHRVPLSEPALRLLRARPTGKSGELIFPSLRNGRQLTDMAMTATVRRMQVDAVPHGLARATFKTWATECSSFPREVVEMALAHTLENKTEEAYWRGDLFEKRVGAMRAWAEFLTQPAPSSGTTPIHRNRDAKPLKRETNDAAC